MKTRLWLFVALLSLSTAVAAEPPPPVTLVPLPQGEALGGFLAAHPLAYLPNGAYTVNEPLVLQGRDDTLIMGAGRLDFDTQLNFGPAGRLRLENCKRVTFCNLRLSFQPGAEGAGIEIIGEEPCDVRFLNCMIGVGGQERGTGLAMRAAGKLLLQACHFFGGNPGLLVDHPKAEVTVLGGNHQSQTVHIRQQAGWLQAYCIGFQLATEGADVEVNGPTPKPIIIAASRSEGPKYILRTPDTDEQIDVIMKACGGAVQAPQPLARYGASGTLLALGNNGAGGFEAPASKGTIVSAGNTFQAGPQQRNPYEIGPETHLYSAGDLWFLLRPGEEFRVPAGGLMDAAAMQQLGYPLPAGLQFLPTGADFPSLPEVPAPLWTPQPVIANIADLIPSVKDWGATGDGVTDDTDALQKALEENRHGPLYFPEGIYRLTRALFLDHRNGGWFVGAGPDKTILTNTGGGGVIRTDGCGYSAWQDLAFVSLPNGPDPAFDLSWDQRNPAPPDFMGSALQANVFYRCHFRGGAVGLCIGREGYMGSETLVVDSTFSGSGEGLAVRNYNALTNNAVGCTFRDNGIHLAQTAGSFNALECTLENALNSDLKVQNSAADAFYLANCTSNGPESIFGTQQTGATINVFFDGCRFTAPPQNLVGYAAGGSVIFVNSDLGAGSISGGSGISVSSLFLINSQTLAEPALILGGRTVGYEFRPTKPGP
jgi:hypothetical protein